MRLERIRITCAVVAALLLSAAGAQAKTHYVRASFKAHGSAEQVYATGLRARATVSLANRAGRVVAHKRADSLGGVVFRGVAPGSGYRVRSAAAHGIAQSPPLTVFTDASAPPSTSTYNQKLPTSGYGYLRTRDGTLLAIDVHLPSGASHGPYPTLVEYAGYGYADPAGPDSGIAPIANLLGFAVVDVNMRGTGCSGGSFDYFEPLQGLDGYDVIETVARQPWVLGHRVGMLGISYGGISQLFVAATDPPHLAAISPLSVIDNTATTLYPGGILNTGFALPWGEQRAHDALPASPTGGQPWAYKRIQDGDEICKANQVLHGEAPSVVGQIRANHYYVPKVANPLAPVTFVHKIHVPVYLACQWTDEQTGGHCADLAQHFTGTRHKWFTFTNGDHIDSLDPQTFDRWYDFLELYVAHRAPAVSASVKALAPTLFKSVLGISGVTLPPDPLQSHHSYAAALAAFQRLEPIRVLFDNGAGGSTPGVPAPGFEQSFSRFPIPGTQARSWYLGANGSLSPKRATPSRQRPLHLETPRPSRHRLHGERRWLAGRPVDGDSDLPLGPESARHRCLLPNRPAGLEHRRDRRRRRTAVDQGLDAQRRSPGDGLRGPPRRQGDVRPERLAASQRAQARCRPEHPPGARPEPPPHRRRAAAQGRLHRGDGPALLRRPRVSPGLADPHQGRRAGR